MTDPKMAAVLTQSVLLRVLAIERPMTLGRQLGSFPIGIVRARAGNNVTSSVAL